MRVAAIAAALELKDAGWTPVCHVEDGLAVIQSRETAGPATWNQPLVVIVIEEMQP